MTATETQVDVFNGLLRGELAATETYQQALEKMGDAPGNAELQALHREHRQAANDIRQHIHELGGEPDQSSGAWGAFAKLVEGTAKVFGKAAALKALKEGEESGLKDYEKASENKELGPVCRRLVSRLRNETRSHVSVLDRLMSAK